MTAQSGVVEDCPRCGRKIRYWQDHTAGCPWWGAAPVTLRLVKGHKSRCCKGASVAGVDVVEMQSHHTSDQFNQFKPEFIPGTRVHSNSGPASGLPVPPSSSMS